MRRWRRLLQPLLHRAHVDRSVAPMSMRSWITVDDEDEGVPAAPAQARDAGWVSTMRAVLEPLAPGRANVLDPFCGFGTTLIAAARVGLTGVGLEIEGARAQRARTRVADATGRPAHIVVGDVRAAPFAASTFDLIATSVPYAPVRSMGAGAGEPLADGNLYASTSYGQHLALLDDALAAAFATLRPGGVAIVCAENLRDDDGALVPFAFDVARIVARHAKLISERIVCYPARPSGLDPLATDRTHEHAFIAVRA